MSTPHEAHVAELIERLSHPDRLERVHAAAALVCLGRQDRRPVGGLIAALRDERVVVRRMAALVLGDLAPGVWEAVPALVKALVDPDPGLRRRVVVALGQFGAAATEAIPALRSLRHDPDEGVRSFSATALTLIEPASRTEPAA